jgi:hypothetical protein
MRSKSAISFQQWLKVDVLRVCRLHFLVAGLFLTQLLIYDAWKVLSPEAILQRWVAIGMYAAIVLACWYLAHNKNNDTPTSKRILFGLIAADIAIASFFVYTQRGMASRAVILFCLPIISSSILLSRSAIILTAGLSVLAYAVSAVAYFVLNFNEGFKIELYAEVGQYSLFMLILAGLLSAVIRFSSQKK